MSVKDSINADVCQVFGGLVLLPLKEFKEMEYMKHHLMNSMREELGRRLTAEKRLEGLQPEYYVQHAQDDGWEPEAGPFEYKADAVDFADEYRKNYPGHKYRVVVRQVTNWEPLENEP